MQILIKSVRDLQSQSQWLCHSLLKYMRIVARTLTNKFILINYIFTFLIRQIPRYDRLEAEDKLHTGGMPLGAILSRRRSILAETKPQACCFQGGRRRGLLINGFPIYWVINPNVVSAESKSTNCLKACSAQIVANNVGLHTFKIQTRLEWIEYSYVSYSNFYTTPMYQMLYHMTAMELEWTFYLSGGESGGWIWQSTDIALC